MAETRENPGNTFHLFYDKFVEAGLRYLLNKNILHPFGRQSPFSLPTPYLLPTDSADEPKKLYHSAFNHRYL